MLEIGPIKGHGLQSKMLLAAAIVATFFGGDAFAGEQVPGAKSAQPPIAASMFAPPLVSSLPLPALQTTAPDFRPRKGALPQGDFAASEASLFDTPMLQDTSIARRMADSKSADRVRLLTLWQARSSSLSLQAGKHGAPTLQWSTPWMHREGTSRGLFDRLITMSPHILAGGGHSALSRQSGTPAAAKSAESGPAGKAQ